MQCVEPRSFEEVNEYVNTLSTPLDSYFPYYCRNVRLQNLVGNVSFT